METITAQITQPTVTATFPASLGYFAGGFSVAATQTLSASSTIAVSSALIQVLPIVSSGGAVTVTSTPTIQTTGVADWKTLLLVVGTSDTDIVTLQDESNLPGSGLHLSQKRDMTFGKNDTCLLLFNGTVWIPLGREDAY